MSNENENLAAALDILRNQMDKMREAKQRANIILREKIDEYEQELELTIDLIEDHLEDEEFSKEIFQQIFQRMHKSEILMSQIHQIKTDMPTPSKN